jgi:hypothetical protein
LNTKLIIQCVSGWAWKCIMQRMFNVRYELGLRYRCILRVNGKVVNQWQSARH